MAFRFSHRSIARDVRRLVRKEFDAASRCLEAASSYAPNIHAARKSIKKIRALMRLLRKPLGRHFYEEDNRLDTAAHRLGELRDADAMPDAFSSLRTGAIIRSIGRPVQRGLDRHRRSTLEKTARLTAEARRLLDHSRDTLIDRLVSVTTPQSVQHGLRRTYRHSREALADLHATSGTAEFHAWRQRVKDHWYQVRLFESIHPTARARAQRLKRLERDLGAEHDLGHLSELLSERPGFFGGVVPTTITLGCIQRRQHTLRERALIQGRRLFGHQPHAFHATVRRWWRAKTHGIR
jgi:CHAD domain-containing protein